MNDFQSLDHTVEVTSFQQLHSLTLTKKQAWEQWISLLEWNTTSYFYEPQQLQKLWMKLIRKYKFKFNDWKNSGNLINFHMFLIDHSGHGLQSLMHFYQSRNLVQWKIHAFEYGLKKLLKENQCVSLEMYFLTQIICESWAHHYQYSPDFNAYYMMPKYSKTKALYEAFINYQKQKESGARLLEYLTAYNPQYQLASKSTPKFYKELHQQIYMKAI